MDPLEAQKRLIQIGDTNRARAELGGLLRSDPNNMEAWELLCSLLDDPNQKADCLKQILRIDPENTTAAQNLKALTTKNDLPSKSEKQTNKEISSTPEEIKRSIDDLRKLIVDDIPDDSPDDLTYQEHEEIGAATKTDTQPAPISFDKSPALGLEDNDPIDDLPYLGPASIVNLAGHPLPKDERLNCPHCDATVSRFETKCPWCSKELTP